VDSSAVVVALAYATSPSFYSHARTTRNSFAIFGWIGSSRPKRFDISSAEKATRRRQQDEEEC